MRESALKFQLSGKTAMFKKPDVNSYAYFTYNNIHKVALLGLLGAVIGLGGYAQQGKQESYPEFYDKLKHLKISIIPDLDKHGIYTKKIQTFNNSVGYASFEEGGNLVVREQWLEDPTWTIYLYDDKSSAFEKIADALINRKAEYIPYLGKNDHPANIAKVKPVDIEKTKERNIHSLVVGEGIETVMEDPFVTPYYFKEIAPIGMNETYNFYEFAPTILTNNSYIFKEEKQNIYRDNDNVVFFY